MYAYLRGLLVGGLVSVSLLGAACDKSNSAGSVPLADLEKQVGYRPGAWWRDAGKLNDLVLAGSQIVITHAGANAQEARAAFLRPAPARSREQALRLALKIKAELREAPEQFAALARQYSDDTRTGSRGGSLGIFRASALPSPVIDAFGNTKHGDVSRVVEAATGFYVIRHDKVPPARQVSARHVVIKYDGTWGWPRVGRTTTRSRVDAKRIADRVAAEARKTPNAFPRLVQEYSEAFDAVAGGDFGARSTYDNGDSVLLSSVAALEVGEVSTVIEGGDGFHVFQRTALSERPVLAKSHLVVSYAGAFEEAHRPPVQRSKDEARALAKRLLDELRAEPERFDALRSQYCDVPWLCAEPIVEPLGRTAGIDHAVAGVAVRGIPELVVETPLGFHVLRRENPEKHAASTPALSFEFAHPPPPDLNWVVANASAEQLATDSKKLAREASDALELQGSDATYFRQIIERFSARVAEVPAAERGQLVRAVQGELKGLLGANRFQAFERFLSAWLLKQQGF